MSIYRGMDEVDLGIGCDQGVFLYSGAVYSVDSPGYSPGNLGLGNLTMEEGRDGGSCVTSSIYSLVSPMYRPGCSKDELLREDRVEEEKEEEVE